MKGVPHLLLAIAIAGLVQPIALPAYAEDAPTTAPVDPRVRFTGSWVYAGDAREQAARNTALERAVETLFFAIRGIARSRLANGTKIEPWIALSFERAMIRSRVPSAPESLSPESGKAVTYVNDGERAQLSQRLVGAKLTQSYIAEEGSRTNELTLSSDGQLLFMKVTIASPKLSAPALYTLTYKRHAATTQSAPPQR